MKINIACQSPNITRMLNQNLSIWLHGQLKFRCILNNFGLSKPCIGNIRRYCIVRESNPGRLRGRRGFYHQTNDAFLQLTNSYQIFFFNKLFYCIETKTWIWTGGVADYQKSMKQEWVIWLYPLRREPISISRVCCHLKEQRGEIFLEEQSCFLTTSKLSCIPKALLHSKISMY